jgi:hypothetical protein
LNRAILRLALLLSTIVVLGYGQSSPASDRVPDTGLRRWEAGFDAQEFHKGGTIPADCDPSKCSLSQLITGIAASLNVNQYFAVDSSVTVTPSGSPYEAGGDSLLEGGRATELLLGARGSVRTRHWGFFAEADPGVLSWSHVILDTSYVEPPQDRSTLGRRNSFAIDMGGGVEYSPQSRMRIRLGLGDLLVHSNNAYTVTFPPPPGSSSEVTHVFASNPWVNELQANGEVSWEFGKPILWMPPDTHQPPSHPFFDRANFAVLTISLLGQAADAITTQRFRHHGISEGDPLARPFVDQGWPGQIGLAVIDNGAQLSVMYALHRMHKHWLERTVPLVFGGDSAVNAYRNDSIRSR